MILFKYILAILLTIPMIVLGSYLFQEYVDRISGDKKKKQAAKEQKKKERRKARNEGFTVHIPDPIRDSKHRK